MSRRYSVVKMALGALSAAFVGTYVIALGYIVVRGAPHALRFTTLATPLDPDIEGEQTLRLVVAALVFGVLYWAIAAAARRASPALARTRAFRAALATGFGVSVVAFRDHLPRFLISFPSETTAGGGIGPELFNTLYFAVISTAITLPVGVGAALYVARFARSRRFVRVFRVALDTLASLPSIVYGLFGFLVFVVQMRLGYSLFAGAFVLALLNLPLVVGLTNEALAAVPRELEDASLALGATPVQTALRVTLPYAWPGISSALVLSTGRVFSESAPLIMTAGTTVSRAGAYSLDPFRGGETLAVHLWYVNSSGLAPDKADVSAATAAVLVLLILATNILAAELARFGGASGGRARPVRYRPR